MIDVSKEFSKAKSLMDRDRCAEALPILNNCLKINPNDIFTKLELGKAYFRTGNIDTSIWYFKSLLRTKIDSTARLFLGRIYDHLDNFFLAQGYFLSILNTKHNGIAMLELGKLYIKYGKYDLARKCLETNLSKPKEEVLLKQLIVLNMKLENYQEAYFYLYEYCRICNFNIDFDLRNLAFFLQSKLGILGDKKADSYYQEQVLDYNEQKAKDHISRHFSREKKSYFIANVNIDELFKHAKKIIDVIPPKEIADVDKYIIDFNRFIGYSNDILTHSICVITIPNTKDIITMYPIISDYHMTNKYVHKTYTLIK